MDIHVTFSMEHFITIFGDFHELFHRMLSIDVHDMFRGVFRGWMLMDFLTQTTSRPHISTQYFFNQTNPTLTLADDRPPTEGNWLCSRSEGVG